MRLIVWLGNPWSEYTYTRHNAGFIITDMIAKDFGIELKFDKSLNAKIGKWYIYDQEIIMVQPMTYMNLSWAPVVRLSSFYKTPLSQIIVLHDEIDIPNAEIRTKFGWSTAWHNGLKDISVKFGTNDYSRIRLWVWRPANSHISVSDWVLWKFTEAELSDLTNKYAYILELLAKILKTKNE